VVEAENGNAVDREGEGTARHDGIENKLEGVEIGRFIAGRGGLNGELEDNKRAVDEMAFPYPAFFELAGLNQG